MEKLTKEELMIIVGGASLSGAVINAFLSASKFVYNLGQSLGSSIRRIGSNSLCKI